MNIYITETNILTQQHPPLQEHVNLGKYSKEKLLETIHEFPDLEHNCTTYRFYNPEFGLVHIVDLAAFAQQANTTTARLNQIKQYKGRTAKGWMFIPPDEEVPQAYYKFFSSKRQFSKKAYANSFKI